MLGDNIYVYMTHIYLKSVVVQCMGVYTNVQWTVAAKWLKIVFNIGVLTIC